MKNVLVVMSFRKVPQVLENQKEFENWIDVAYLRSYKENQLALAFKNLQEKTDYDNYILASDDMIVTKDSLNKVIDGLKKFEIFTGYCNLINYDDSSSPFSFIRTFGKNSINISKKRLTINQSYNYDDPEIQINSDITIDDYYFIDRSEIDKYFPEKDEEGYFEIPNTGLALFGMRKEIWEKYPLFVYKFGGASDHHISWRLNRDNLKIFTHKDTFSLHLKCPATNTCLRYPEWYKGKGSIILKKMNEPPVVIGR
jgi:hypothetical protein